MASTEIVSCPLCEGVIGSDAKKCKHCGEWVARGCERCGTPLRGEWAARGECAECQTRRRVPTVYESALPVNPKSRGVAVASAFLLGGVGAHRFYLGNWLAGFMYILFCWTLIPSVVGVIEGIRYAVMDEAEFHRRYSV